MRLLPRNWMGPAPVMGGNAAIVEGHWKEEVP